MTTVRAQGPSRWRSWHAAYDDPASALSQRLEVVKARLTDALDALDAVGAVAPSILSLCAGEGRDVLAVLSARAAPVGRVVLVELDGELAARAVRSAAEAGLGGVEVRCADAGVPASFSDVLPVDVLLCCGIFGNVAHERVRAIVGVLPRLVAPGGFVVWTRGGSEPDRRPEVRRWFAEAGMEEVAFDGAPAPYGVGLHRLPAGALHAGPLPERLFTFSGTEDARRSPRGRDPRGC